MAPTMRDQLNRLPLRNLKAELRTGESELQKMKRAAGEALDLARSNAELEPKQMAGDLGISHSLVVRAFKGQDDIGFLRLYAAMDDRYWTELIVTVAKRRKLASVRTLIEIPDRQVG